MIQRVYALIESGLDEEHLVRMVALPREEVADEHHWRDERQIAAALRRLADHIELGASFAGVQVESDLASRTYGPETWNRD